MIRLTPQQKLIIIILIGGVFLVILAIVITQLSKPTTSSSPTSQTVIIDNRASYSLNVSQEVFDAIGTQVYGTVSNNVSNLEDVYHGTIRGGSYSLSSSGIVSFILDMPSIEYSWKVSQFMNEQREPLSDASVLCVSQEEVVYPTKPCVDLSTGGRNTEEQAQVAIGKILPLEGPGYRIVLEPSTTEKESYALFITIYSAAGKDNALAALRSLGYSPGDYEIVYINK